CKTLCRCSHERVHHYQQLHQVLIRRRTRRLYDKDIGSANVFADLQIKFALRKTFGACLAEVAAKMPANFFGERPVRVSRKDLDVACYAHSMLQTLVRFSLQGTTANFLKEHAAA